MKKNYSIVCLVQTIIMVLAVSFPVIVSSQELTAEQKQEKCQNNVNRIAELEAELGIINADLSETMEKKEIVDARNKIDYVRSMKIKWRERHFEAANWRETERIAFQYNFNFDDCVKRNPDSEYPGCLTELEDLIDDKIKKAVSLENLRPALINKKNEIDKQLASHRNRLIELGCNQSAGTLVNNIELS